VFIVWLVVASPFGDQICLQNNASLFKGFIEFLKIEKFIIFWVL